MWAFAVNHKRFRAAFAGGAIAALATNQAGMPVKRPVNPKSLPRELFGVAGAAETKAVMRFAWMADYGFAMSHTLSILYHQI